MKPANFVLDLLRTYGHKGTSAQNVMTSAQMFAFNDNVIRVTLSRLTSKGILENISRGHYRLAPGSDPINDFVEEWRLGEKRKRTWRQRFVTLYVETETERQRWVLEATGFRQLGKKFWARPDNLRRHGADLHKWLEHLGIDPTVIVGEGVMFKDRVIRTLIEQYSIASLQKQYKIIDAQLNNSALSLEQLPRKKAMKQSFELGGKALQLLAKDPYLPEEIMPIGDRIKLHKTMLAYDELGRRVWSGEPGSLPSASPRYAQSMQA